MIRYPIYDASQIRFCQVSDISNTVDFHRCNYTLVQYLRLKTIICSLQDSSHLKNKQTNKRQKAKHKTGRTIKYKLQDKLTCCVLCILWYTLQFKPNRHYLMNLIYNLVVKNGIQQSQIPILECDDAVRRAFNPSKTKKQTLKQGVPCREQMLFFLRKLIKIKQYVLFA